MTAKPSKSAGTKSTTKKSSSASKPTLVKGKGTAASTDALTTPEVVEDDAPERNPSRPAAEWLTLARTRLDVKPWVLRAAVEGHSPERKYTEHEIRRLIQRKLNEPA